MVAGLNLNQRPLGYEPFSNRDWRQRATNNAMQISASHVLAFGTSLALLGSNFLGNSWVQSGPGSVRRRCFSLTLAAFFD
jgi:hypothetical protein